MALQTKQQKRACFALTEIENLMKDGCVSKDMVSLLVGLPNMILANGIGQTLVFLLTKKEKEGKAYRILKKWLQAKESGQFADWFAADSDITFLKKFNSISQEQYVETQHECLRLVEWLKRYARAFPEKEPEKESGNE